MKKISKKEIQEKKIDFRFELSNLITEARYAYGLTQIELAVLLKTHQPSIARLESGLTLPSLTFLERLADALGTYLIAPKFGFMEKKISENKTITPITINIGYKEYNIHSSFKPNKTVSTINEPKLNFEPIKA